MGHIPLLYPPPLCGLWLCVMGHIPLPYPPPLCGLWLCVMGHIPLPYPPSSLWPVALRDGTHPPTIPAPLSVACGFV